MTCPGSGVSVPVLAAEQYTSAVARRIGQPEVIVTRERRFGQCPVCGRRLALRPRRSMPPHVREPVKGR